MQDCLTLDSERRANAALPSLSVGKSNAQRNNDVCWNGKSVNHFHTVKTQLKDKDEIDDIFSRMTLWTPSPESTLHKPFENDSLQRKEDSFFPRRAMPHPFPSEHGGNISKIVRAASPINSEINCGLWIPGPEKTLQPETYPLATPVVTTSGSRQINRGTIPVGQSSLVDSQLKRCIDKTTNKESSRNNWHISMPQNIVHPEPGEGRELWPHLPCQSSFDSAQDEWGSVSKCRSYLNTLTKLNRLKNKIVTGEIWRVNFSRTGEMYGFACYMPDNSTQLKIRFTIHNDSKDRNNTADQFQFVQGILCFNDADVKRFLVQNGTNLLQKAYHQRTETSPFYLIPGTIRLLQYRHELSGEKAAIFEHIKSLSGKEIIAEILQVNFGKAIAVAWYDFNIGGRTFGTPVACKIYRLPGYKNQAYEKLTIESFPPAYQVKGLVRVDVLRLHQSVLNHCPPQYTVKSVITRDGLPVYIVKDSIQIVPSPHHDKVTIQHKRNNTLMKYP